MNDRFGSGLGVGVALGCVTAFFAMARLVDYEREALMVEIAKGEIACEYHRSELICWNPKEEEK